jgi:hypothetical protein
MSCFGHTCEDRHHSHNLDEYLDSLMDDFQAEPKLIQCVCCADWIENDPGVIFRNDPTCLDCKTLILEDEE